MPDIFTFVSTGLEPDAFRILRFTGTEAVSEYYSFDFELLALKEFDVQALYDTDASFTLSRQDGTETSYHGRVASVTVERLMGAGKHFTCKVRLVPHLWFYTLRKSCRAYVGKSISQIIDAELRDSGEGTPGGFTIRYNMLPQYTFPLVVKYHETPLEFISRLLQRECLYYYFLTEGGKDTLIFSSDSKLASNEAVTARVINELAYSSLGVDDERVLSKVAHMAQTQRPERVTLYAFDGNPGSVEVLHGIGRTAIEKNLLGPLRDISSIRQIQDNRKSLHYNYTMATSIRGLRVGIVYDGLRALSLRHEGDQSSTVLESLGLQTKASQKDFYRNQGVWIPEGEAYIPEWALKTPRIADAALTGFTTRINDNGTYDVRCHSIDPETNLPNIRMMFPFAGQKGNASGLHFPLVDGTEVLLEFLEGDPDRPVILGALYNTSLGSPVSALNRQSHILETPQGQMFHLIDGEDNKIHIEGQNRVEMLSQSELLEVDGTKAHIQGHSSNLVSFHADGGTQLVLDGSGDKVNLQAGESVKMTMDHGGSLIGMTAQATSADIDGQNDNVTLNTGAGTRAVVSGSGNSIQMNTHGGSALDLWGGSGDANLYTGAGQAIELSKAADSVMASTSGGAQSIIKATQTFLSDGSGQFIQMNDGGQAIANFKDAIINLSNVDITAENIVILKTGETVLDKQDDIKTITGDVTTLNCGAEVKVDCGPVFTIRPFIGKYSSGDKLGFTPFKLGIDIIRIDIAAFRLAISVDTDQIGLGAYNRASVGNLTIRLAENHGRVCRLKL
jgi:Uncharacterized protein conserved in bacteria